MKETFVKSPKRLLAALLSICLVLGMFPASIFTVAAEESAPKIGEQIYYEIEDLAAAGKITGVDTSDPDPSPNTDDSTKPRKSEVHLVFANEGDFARITLDDIPKTGFYRVSLMYRPHESNPTVAFGKNTGTDSAVRGVDFKLNAAGLNENSYHEYIARPEGYFMLQQGTDTIDIISNAGGKSICSSTLVIQYVGDQAGQAIRTDVQTLASQIQKDEGINVDARSDTSSPWGNTYVTFIDGATLNQTLTVPLEAPSGWYAVNIIHKKRSKGARIEVSANGEYVGQFDNVLTDGYCETGLIGALYVDETGKTDLTFKFAEKTGSSDTFDLALQYIDLIPIKNIENEGEYDPTKGSISKLVNRASLVATTGRQTKTVFSDEGPVQLFDENVDTKVGVNWNRGEHDFVLTFSTYKPVVPRFYTMATANDSPERDPKSWVLYGSVDGENYEIIHQVSDYMFPAERKVYLSEYFATGCETAYSYFKMVVTEFKSDTESSLYPQFSELRITTGVDEEPVEIEPGLVLHYDFENGATDVAGNYNGSVHHKGVEIENGIARFFGNGAISVPVEALHSDQLTLTMMLNLRHRQTWGAVFEAATKHDDGKDAVMKFLPQTGDEFNDSISMTVRNGVGPEENNQEMRVSDASTKLPTDEWVQLTYVQDGAVGKVYLNDTLVAERDDLIFRPTQLNPYGYALIGGGKYWDDALLTGSVSDFRIYNVALDDSAIADLTEENLAEVIEVDPAIFKANNANPVAISEDGSRPDFRSSSAYCGHPYAFAAGKKATFGLEPGFGWSTITLDIPAGAKSLVGLVDICQEALEQSYGGDMSIDFLVDNDEEPVESIDTLTREVPYAEFNVSIPDGAEKLIIKINNPDQKWDHLTFFETYFLGDDVDTEVLEVFKKIDYIDTNLVAIPGYVISKIETAREAYDALTYEQKAKVSNYEALLLSEAAHEHFVENFDYVVYGWQDEFKDYPWLNRDNTTEEERQATRDAFADEVKYQYLVNNYLLANRTSSEVGNWMNIPGFGLEDRPNDNIDNPWGDTRQWAIVTSPFAGMAFSEKGYFAVRYSYQAALGNSFKYEGKVYQVTWRNLRFHDDVPLVKGKKDVGVTDFGYFPGNGGEGDITNNTFRYAYALYSQTHKWENKVLGAPFSNARYSEDDRVVFQRFEGPNGVAFIAANKEAIESVDPNSGKPEGAYVIVEDMAQAFLKLGEGAEASAAAAFLITGAPTGNQYELDGLLIQDFENGKLVVTESGFSKFYTDDIDPDQLAADIVIAMIEAIPDVEEIKLSDEADVLAARSAYDDLTEDQKALVPSEIVDVLVAAEQKIYDLKHEHIINVINMIDALPEVEQVQLSDKDAVYEAKDAYDLLNEADHEEVTNRDKLFALLDRIAELEDEAAAAPVIEAINNLPEIEDLTLADEEAVNAAQDAYDMLTDSQKALVDEATGTKLADAIDRIEELKKEAAAEVVITAINNLPAFADITVEDADAIAAVKAQYNALPSDVKPYVTNLLKLRAAETRIWQITPDPEGYMVVYADDLEVASENHNKFWTIKDKPTFEDEGKLMIPSYCQEEFNEIEYGIFQEPKGDVEYSTLRIPVPAGATKFITLYGRIFGASTLSTKKDGTPNWGDNGKNYMEVYAGDTLLASATHYDGYARLVECEIPAGTTEIIIRNYKGDNNAFDHILFGMARFLVPENPDFENTIAAINAIGDEITYKSGAAIEYALELFNKLSQQEQDALPNKDKLQNAVEAFEQIVEDFADSINLSGWTSNLYSSNWMENITEEEKQATLDALKAEIVYQYSKGNNIGYGSQITGLDPDGHHGGWVLIQLDIKPNDNLGNPWGHGERYWAYAQAPFVGIAFSAHSYMSVGTDRIGMLGNQFEYEGKIYQQFFNFYKYHDVTERVKDRNVPLTQVDLFPGAHLGADVTNNNFRYAFADYNYTYKLEGKTLGIPESDVEVTESGVAFQKFIGPDGVAYIVGDTAEFSKGLGNAFVVSGEILETILALDEDVAAAFEIVGAPTGKAEDGKQTFANGAIENGTFVEFSGVEKLIAEIDKLPEADDINRNNYEDYIEKVDSLVETYNDLSEEEQDEVTNSDKLFEVKEKIDQVAADDAAVKAVEELIDNLPFDIRDDNYEEAKADTEHARAEYENLTEEQKALVGNYEYLVEVEALIREYEDSKNFVLGDANGDGEVTVADIIAVRRHIMGMEELTGNNLKAANADQDEEGEITVADVIAIRRIIMSQSE